MSCLTLCLRNNVSDIILFLPFMQTKEDLEAAAEKEKIAGDTDQQDNLEDKKDDVVHKHTVCLVNAFEI